jgi:hypothetical protein
MSRIKLDPEANVVREQFAVVYAPRRHRDRFPDNCVQAVESRTAAIAQADIGARRYPAIVLGPSRSSEGYMLYYLVQWLDEGE